MITLINYMLQAGKTVDADTFIRELAQRVPQHKDELMTIAQQLEQKGIEKGRMEGCQEGIQLGKRAATLKIARAMLQNGFDQNMVMQMTGLTEDELAQIRY